MKITRQSDNIWGLSPSGGSEGEPFYWKSTYHSPEEVEDTRDGFSHARSKVRGSGNPYEKHTEYTTDLMGRSPFEHHFEEEYFYHTPFDDDSGRGINQHVIDGRGTPVLEHEFEGTPEDLWNYFKGMHQERHDSDWGPDPEDPDWRPEDEEDYHPFLNPQSWPAPHHGVIYPYEHPGYH